MTVEVDEHTHRALELAARISNITTGEVVARLVVAASMPRDESSTAEREPKQKTRRAAVYADYEGHRTHGTYDRDTSRIDITSGPLAGRSFKTPTGAARAVVGHFKPSVNRNRNGWSFWTVDDGSGKPLQTIRYAV